MIAPGGFASYPWPHSEALEAISRRPLQGTSEGGNHPSMRETQYSRYYVSDALEGLRALPDECVHACVTSPPYYLLREYIQDSAADAEIGRERSVSEYVARLVEVFEEVRRVLRPDGTCWIVIGDTYNSYPAGRRPGDNSAAGSRQESVPGRSLPEGYGLAEESLKVKDLIGVPWRLAFALQEAGWYLRSAITWVKAGSLPESVSDRPVRGSEQVFMLAKNPRYFYDAAAVREPSDEPGREPEDGTGHAMRDVWQIPVRSYPGAHTATFPLTLPRRVIAAATSEKGVCPECGAPWRRVEERERGFAARYDKRAGIKGGGRRSGVARPESSEEAPLEGAAAPPAGYRGIGYTRAVTVGWEPSCGCGTAGEVLPYDREVIESPARGVSCSGGEGNGKREDPSLLTGRAGMNRPRLEGEGRTPMTRYEQRRYAAQLKASFYRERMAAEAVEYAGADAFAHYERTDRQGARPVPEPLLSRWVERGWLSREASPPPPGEGAPEPVPALVLDPFMGAATTAVAARELGRASIGFDLDARNLAAAERRLSQDTLF